MKRMLLTAMLACLLLTLSGCFIQPDPTLDPLVITEGVIPFGTVQPLPTNTPTAVPQATPSPTPDTWQSSDQSTWEDWTQGGLPTATPRSVATTAPDAQSWMTSTQDYYTGYPVLRMGSTGSDVSDLQARLTELGYYTGSIDGKYAAGTQTAVAEFQTRSGLAADGIAGRQTQDLLYSSAAQPKYVSATAADPGQARTLSLGMTGNDVFALQARLIELRYLTGVADGVFGEETKEALIAFQRNNNLTADGNAGASTLRKIAGSCKAATRVTPSPAPSGTVTLREGDTGENVYILQARLFELGYYTGRIDGRFSEEMTMAVTQFQMANGLTADGIAGKGTQNKLTSGTAVPANAGGGLTPPAALSTLRRGDENGEVLVLQQYLMSLGYLSTQPDGQFGSATERAVKLFQEANGLTADGVAGRGTLSILYGDNAVHYSDYFGADAQQGGQPVVTVTPTPKPNTDIVIQWESEGDDVRQYQARLVELGYLQSRYVTGKFNQPTVDATKAFQTMNGLKVDGAAGPQSLKLIYSGDALDASGARVGDQISGASDTAVSEVLTAGMSGDQVRSVQKRLSELGYLSASYVSGVYDTQTQQAIRQFQQANGLASDGVAGSATQSRLYATSAVTAQTARVTGDNSTREGVEYRLNGAYQTSIGGGGIVVGDRNYLYLAYAAEGGALVRRAYNGSGQKTLSNDVPRFLHLTNGRLYYVASDGGEDCIIRLNADGTGREVLYRAGIILRFALHDGVLYYLDANSALKERTLSGQESELMEGVADFTLDAQGDALLCVTQEGVISFGIDTGRKTTLYAGAADQAAMCGQVLLVRSGGSIVRVANGQSAAIRRDGAAWLGVYGQKVLQLTGSGVVTCDVNGENATTILYGEFENASIANGVLYVGDGRGYQQQVSL